ncbi:hypothetical protein ACWEL8_09750 [Streptomyces sp. NPDC004690]
MTLTDPFLPEDLLALGADFVRHHDTLTRLHTHSGLASIRAVTEHIPVTQALARRTLDAHSAVQRAPRLYHSSQVRATLDRMRQLATLSVIAGDHLIHATDVMYGDREQAEAPPGPLQAIALKHILHARELTSLGAEDCLATAGLLAREMHEQNRVPIPRPPTLSPAQHGALLAVAAGRVTLELERVSVERGGERITITTLRSLESRDLIQREPCVLWLRDERPYLTPEGRRAVAAVLSRPRSSPPTATRAPARPAAARSAVR